MDSRSMKLRRKMQPTVSHDKSSICVPHYAWSWLWRGYLCYLSARDLVFSPCVRGGSQITFTFTGLFTLPSSDSNVCL
jgi:hypothetical protein